MACTKIEHMTQENIKSKWIKNTFAEIEQNKYPRVKAISWWHDNFDHSRLRIDTSPERVCLRIHIKSILPDLFRKRHFYQT